MHSGIQQFSCISVVFLFSPSICHHVEANPHWDSCHFRFPAPGSIENPSMTSPSRSNNTWWLLLFLLILQLTSSLCRSIGWDDENKVSIQIQCKWMCWKLFYKHCHSIKNAIWTTCNAAHRLHEWVILHLLWLELPIHVLYFWQP